MDLELAEKALRSERRKVSALQRELAERMNSSPKAKEAWMLFEIWRRMCRPKAREFGTERMKVVMARLNGGYTAADIAVGIEGAACFPFVKDGITHNDIKLICSEAKKLDNFMARGRKAMEEGALRRVLEERMGKEAGTAEWLALAAILEQVPGFGPDAGITD